MKILKKRNHKNFGTRNVSNALSAKVPTLAGSKICNSCIKSISKLADKDVKMISIDLDAENE